MKLAIIFLLFVCFENDVNSQDIKFNCPDTSWMSYTKKDIEVFNKIQQFSDKDSLKSKPIAEAFFSFARFLINTTYGAGSRGIHSEDKLLINFQELDCVTFVENAMALAFSCKNDSFSFCVFAEELKKIRYRNGVLGLFPSRLHYFTDWVYDNELKGLVKNISGTIDTIPYKKNIDYMSVHKNLYPRLADTSFCRQIIEIENKMNNRSEFYLPKEKIEKYKNEIQTGDIIVFTSTIQGLDVSHVGIAFWESGDLFLIHASSQHKKVMKTQIPLMEYLQQNKKFSGIIAVRLNNI